MLTLSTPSAYFIMPTKKSAARKPTRPYHHGNLRRALLDEALSTIRREGVEGVTLREIGARVGVSRTALYRHFTDKSALISAVAAEGFRTLREQLAGAWESKNGGIGGFEAMGQAYVQFAVANPTHFRVMFSRFIDREPADPQLATEGAGAFTALVHAVAELQRAGQLRADDTELMARHIWAVVHGVANLAIDGQLPEPDGIEKLTRYSIERLQLGIARAQ